jgi:hypothetical protein
MSASMIYLQDQRRRKDLEASRKLSESREEIILVDAQLMDTEFSILGDIAVFNNEKAKGRSTLNIVFK